MMSRISLCKKFTKTSTSSVYLCIRPMVNGQWSQQLWLCTYYSEYLVVDAPDNASMSIQLTVVDMSLDRVRAVTSAIVASEFSDDVTLDECAGLRKFRGGRIWSPP